MILTNHPSFFEELGLTSFTTQQKLEYNKIFINKSLFINIYKCHFNFSGFKPSIKALSSNLKNKTRVDSKLMLVRYQLVMAGTKWYSLCPILITRTSLPSFIRSRFLIPGKFPARWRKGGIYLIRHVLNQFSLSLFCLTILS